MSIKRMKRFTAFLTALIMLNFLVVTVGTAVADKYYPGPEESPEEPVVIETPEPTEAPTEAPTGAPTEAPTAEPTPVPVTPEPKLPDPEPEPTPIWVPEGDYTLTVYYKYTDGSEAAIPYVIKLNEGASFMVYSPVIPGFYVTHLSVSGVMEDRDMAIAVYYYYAEEYAEIEDYDTPLGLGGTVINIGDCYE